MKTSLISVLLLGLTALPVLAQEPGRAAAQVPAKAELEQLKGRLDTLNDPEQLLQAAYLFNQSGDVESELKALERRAAARPHLGIYKLDWAAGLAREDRKSEAYTVLIGLQNTGYAYDLRGDARWKNISETQVWNYLTENLEANGKHFGTGKLLHTLPREDLLIESLAWDPSRKTLLVGGAREGAVYSVGKDGKLSTLIKADAKNGLWAVTDVAVDAKRNLLWVASTAVPHYKGYDPQKDMGRAGIFKFDLKNGKLLDSYLSPGNTRQTFFLSSLALGEDGAVYAADGVNNVVYQVREGQFRRILHAPMLSSISALAVSGDDKRLYLADIERGLIGFDLATLKPFDVRVPDKLTLEAISAMRWYQDGLVILQGGMQPQRVMQLRLNAEGNTITGLAPLEAANPAFDLPSAMALDGNNLYLIGNSQKDNYDRYGLLKDKNRLQGTRIVHVDISQRPEPPVQAPVATP